MALPKLNKNVLFLGGAIVLGLIAALLSVSYIQERVAEATAAARVKVAETEVVVSRRNLEIGDTIAESDMVTRTVPVDFVPADAVTTDNYAGFIDRMVRSPIKQGTPLSASALVPMYDKFSHVIVPGKVGYTLSVNENNSISGMIAPGDRVDILLTYDADANAGDGPKVKQGERVAPLLENITVLATGTRIGDLPDGADSTAFSSVTLELDPDQAELLTVGQKAGEVRVLLRNHEDNTPFGLSGISEKTLMSLFGGGGGDDVEYIIGGN
ncbi:Flp pilus assembly protein CpaB [Marilutibacter aestuarii]|uniref:Flp pilus assembly protein CpaB n=1 Tax=Marilutibacter aestuarii TaxID=1706195 RepID=UPI001FE45274|nr:Flp pilus assembly protein CpaB [Lysobacter aestuarii]